MELTMFAFRFLSVRFRFGFVRQEVERRRNSYAVLLILICTKIQWREPRSAQKMRARITAKLNFLRASPRVRVVALRSFAKAQTVRLCSVLDLP
jgi:hypothetical protein